MDFVTCASRHLFFTGKGGVGKTSLSCATAVALADQGKRVLLVSTDPASNLDEVLGLRLSSKPAEVPGAAGLWAMNIDPEAAARDYRERLVGPYRGVLPDAAVASIEEQLSGACTIEIAAFDEFSKLLGSPHATADFDHVIFDTAPTGHTLRLLQLPAAWSGFLDSNTAGSSCLGPLAGLEAQRELYAATLRALSDPNATTVILVSRPERSALAEADRTRGELAALGIANQRLVLNGVFSSTDPADPVAAAMKQRGQTALSHLPDSLAALPRTDIPLQAHNLLGVDLLRQLLRPPRAATPRPANGRPDRLPPALASIIPDLSKSGCGVIMTMGKGGVGKTTIATAIAVELARLGHRVELSTTDPASHVDLSLTGQLPGLHVSRIDPALETRAYRDEVITNNASGLDEQGRRLLEEDLRSPCTEEIAVFRAFAKKVAQGRDAFVVLDTAPTGHTLLLLDATEAYHRQVLHTMSNLPGPVRQLLPRLRDPEFTRVLIITLPEATPVHEAATLQQDLARAHIHPWAWVINQSLSPLELTDPVLLARRDAETPYIDETLRQHAPRAVLVPWLIQEPTGFDGLRRLIHPNT